MNKKTLTGFIVTIIIGLGMAFLGYALIKDNLDFAKTAQKTTAEVTRMDRTFRNGARNNVYVTYSADGKVYEELLGNYPSQSSFAMGKKIEILYDPLQPEKINQASLFNLLGGESLILLFGIIIILSAVIPLIKRTARNTSNGKLKKSGQMVMADICGVNDTNHIRNGVRGRFIICQCLDGEERYEFKSEKIFMDVAGVIERLGLKQLPVYCNVINREKYFIDLSVLSEDKK